MPGTARTAGALGRLRPGEHRNCKDITGERAGRLTAVRRADHYGPWGHPLWVYKCDCGALVARVPNAVRALANPMCPECRRYRPEVVGGWAEGERVSKGIYQYRCLACGHLCKMTRTRAREARCSLCARRKEAQEAPNGSLRQARCGLGLTMQAAADRAGVSRQRWQQWEKQPSLTDAVRRKAFAALGLPAPRAAPKPGVLCPVCQKAVPPGKGRKYCSDRCRRRSKYEAVRSKKSPHPARACEGCGEAFSPAHGNRKTCDKCRRRNAGVES